MFLKKLALFNFKNHAEATFTFNSQVNCFTGPNGSGKTNILDAIHYLGLCKSYFNSTDSLNILHNENYFTIHGAFDFNNSTEDVYVGLKQGQRKIAKRNTREYTRLSEHVGLIPVVMIAPADQQLITGGSEERRKSMDGLLCQVDKSYLENLTAYVRILQQRNALLKQMAANRIADENSLLIWDEQLVLYGKRIYDVRKQFMDEIAPVFAEYCQFISGNHEHASLLYESQMNETGLTDLLKQHRGRDYAVQYTTCGIHKDDIEFQIENKSARRFGSQGQQKSLVIAWKLAQYKFLSEKKSTQPILLLDDIFEKLDDKRMTKLLELVSTFGQLFVTDTHPGRATSVFSNLNITVSEYNL